MPWILALRFTVLQGVIDEIAGPLAGQLVVVPSNPLTIDAHGSLSRVLRTGSPRGRSWPGGCRPGRAWPWRSEPCRRTSSCPPATGHRSRRFSSTRPTTTGPAGEVERLIRTAGFEPVKAGGIEGSGRLEVGGDLHDLVIGPTEARSLIGRA